jgi:L-asparaginase/Glu-tRNA(Gln) amidotransferase subunit D
MSAVDHGPTVEVLTVTPALASNESRAGSLFDVVAESGAAALILIGYATGTTPTVLNPAIKRTVEKDVPVFILSDNKGENRGPQRLVYETQVKAVSAGATPLRDVNVNHIAEVIARIKEGAQLGKGGQELTEWLVEEYGTPSVESSP